MTVHFHCLGAVFIHCIAVNGFTTEQDHGQPLHWDMCSYSVVCRCTLSVTLKGIYARPFVHLLKV